MAKNNYLHMKLRESREEITRLKEELEASEKAAEERDRETTGKAAEQIEREQEAARVERKRVTEQLEAAEADREKVASQLQEAEERAQRDREQHKTRTRVFVTGSMLLVGIVIATLAGAFGGGSEVIVVPTTVASTTTSVSTSVSTPVSTPVTTSPPSTSVAVPPTTTVESVRATTSLVLPATTTTSAPALPVDPEAEEPVEPIDEEAVLLEIYELWEVGERVQLLQIVLGMQADWTYGPSTFDRHVRELIDRGLSLDHLPAPPTTSTTLPPFDDRVNNLYPNQQVQDFKHPGVLDEWIFFGRAGTSVQVQMTSGHFDTYLEVFGPLGGLIALNDDHLGTDSFVSVQLCETGAYTVHARSFGSGNEQLGYYSILLSGGDVVFDALLQKCETVAG